MKSEPIASICFERYGVLQQDKTLEHGYFVQRDRGARYTFSLQVGIWRKDILSENLRDFESPWEFEEIGNTRSYGIKERFYVQEKNTPPVFDYNVKINTGYGLYRGKWLRSNEDLFYKEGIKCNFEQLGFFEDKSQFVVNKRTIGEKIAFYSKHPLDIFNTIVAICKGLLKKCYWALENIIIPSVAGSQVQLELVI